MSAAIALAALAVAASPAAASYVSVSHYPDGQRGLLYYAEIFSSDFGRDNTVGLSGSATAQTLTEFTPSISLLAGPGCVSSFKVAKCSSPGIDRIDMFFGAGNDEVAQNGIPVSVPAFMDGGDGHDRLNGGPAGDVIEGGSGNDRFNGNSGSDQMLGGPGSDAAWYDLKTSPVTVTLDGAANDGTAGESDNADVENATGGSAGDELTGDDGANYLYGFAGDDVIRGRGGKDLLFGDAGDDRLWPEGNDFLIGGSGLDVARFDNYTVPVKVTIDNTANDGAEGETGNVSYDVEEVIGGSAGDELIGNANVNWLSGDAGDDVVEGLGGSDRLVGNQGDDTILALDNAIDRIWCGDGYDTVIADKADILEDDFDCEAVSKP